MPTGGRHNGPHLEDQLRLVIVDSPDVAAPLVGALDVADIGAWMWMEAERALYFSPRVLELLGIHIEPRANLVSRVYQRVHPDDQSEVRRLLRGERDEGPYRLRYRFTPPDGPLRWIEDRGRVERSASGTLVRQGGILRDVTQEVGRELERREADARLEALVNAMPFAVWGRSGPNLVVTHQNAVSIESWGDMRGRGLQAAPAEVRAHWESQLAEALSGQVVRTRHQYRQSDEVRVLHEIVAPVIVEDQVTGAVGVAIDVTDEARAERFAALLTELSADFASRAADDVAEGIVASLEKLARFLGAPVAVLCEISKKDTLRITHWWVDPATGRDTPRRLDLDVAPLSDVLQPLATNSPVIVRSREELPENSRARHWLAEQKVQSLAIVPAPQTDGARTILVVGAESDQVIDWPDDTIPSLRMAATLLGSVLARARAENHQRLVERRMQEAQKLESLGVLAGGIAHDFNNLLTAILGHASLLRAEFGEIEGIAGSLDQIEGASRRAADLCRQMLAYAGRGRFALQVMDLNALVRDMQTLLQITVPKKSTLRLSLAPTLLPVLADDTQIRQLIMNLLINASEALGEDSGTITIRTAAGRRTADELAQTVFSPQLPDGEYVSLSVSDTGEGMTPETTARIFDPFFSTRFTGRGLGLAAVVGIVRAHKGALRVESRKGQGSTFELLLPACEGRVAAAPEPFSPGADALLATWRTTGTVLVVDDEQGVRDLVQNVLTRLGMQVVLCADGQSGVATFREMSREVRLVLLDLTMPGLDGREALREMRAIREDVPAILMSGYSPADLVNASNHAFLQKPFTPLALRAIIKRVLGE